MANKNQPKKKAPVLTPAQQAVANAGLPVPGQMPLPTSVPIPTLTPSQQAVSAAGLPVPQVAPREGDVKPSGIAGSEYVYQGGNWILRPRGGGTFTTLPGGGLTPAATVSTTPAATVQPVTVIPGPGGQAVGSDKTLAVDTFVNTLALLIGKEEASKDYVKKLFALAAPYYRTGSSIDEAMNLALREAQQNNAIPEFTRRFRAIKALEDKRRAGIPVEVPTIAEFVKSQEALADVMRTAGLGDLANEDFLNDVMSTGKSVRETTSIINDVFNAIDLAPEPVKAEIRRALPFADRNTLAKAILTGEKGLKELEQTRTRSEVQAAARQAGVSLADAAAQELANAGFTFRRSVPKFGQVKQAAERGTFLTSLTGEAPVTQQQAIGAIFNEAADQLESLGKIEEKERLRFQGRTGAVKLASQARGRGGAF